MHAKYLRSGGWVRVASAVLLLSLLAACGNANATPTVSVAAVYTAAFQTLAAQQATQQALVPPTSTPPPPTALPSLPAPSPLPTFVFSSPTAGGTIGGGGGACDSSAFVMDVTIPDNTILDPGKSFTKTWRLLNNGTCTWGSGYKFAFEGGDQMNGSTFALANSVPPGSSIDISVKLIAPTSSGSFKGIWQMQNASNQFFGDKPFVLIKVTGGPTATAGPSPTASVCASNICTVTVSANVPDFTITITDSSKHHLTECHVPSGGRSCTFTVELHWDGTVTISGKKYSWSPSNTCTLTDVTTSSRSCTFTGSSIQATSTP